MGWVGKLAGLATLLYTTQAHAQNITVSERCSKDDYAFAATVQISSQQLEQVTHLPYACTDLIGILQEAHEQGKAIVDVTALYALAPNTHMFEHAINLRSYIFRGGTPELLARTLALQNSAHERFEWGVLQAIDAILLIDKPSLEQLAMVTNHDGTPLFSSNPDALLRLEFAGISATYARELTAVAQFTPQDMLNFHDRGGTVEYARQWSGITETGELLYRFLQLGLTRSLFATPTTEKPNALVTLPASDYNGAFYENPGSRFFFQQLMSAYDVRFVLTRTENDLYTAILQDPHIDFLMIQGHGTPQSIRFLDEDGERTTIDTTDTELNILLHMLPRSATIFLHSCSTGRGGSARNNLANHLYAWSEHRTVISSQVDYSITNMFVFSYYPFDVRIRVGRDQTYVPGQAQDLNTVLSFHRP
jgi:hypothetical protein